MLCGIMVFTVMPARSLSGKRGPGDGKLKIEEIK
jgi:hypothetical protein